MGKVTLRAWILLILLPLIPVIVLYIFFAGQNYFELKDAAKGIVAGSVDAKNLKLGTQTSGSAKILSGQIEIIIPSTEAKADSKIYITPTGSTFGKILYVGKEEKDIVPGESFKVKFDGDPVAADITLDWLVVN